MASHKWIRRFRNRWISKKREGLFFFLAFLLVCVYFAGTLLNEYELAGLSRLLRQTGAAGFLILAAALLAHENLHAISRFLDQSADQDHLPKKQIEYVNSFCMTVFLTLAVLFMVILPVLLRPVWTFLAAWFSRLAQNRSSGPVSMDMELPAFEATADPALPADGLPSAPSAWALILEHFLMAVGWMLAALALFWLLRTGIKAAWEWLTRPRAFDDDEKICLKPTLSPFTKKLSGETGLLDLLRPGLSRNVSERIRVRRRYRKELLARARKQKHRLQPWATPEELEASVGLEDPKLHEDYEKARYGPEDVR